MKKHIFFAGPYSSLSSLKIAQHIIFSQLNSSIATSDPLKNQMNHQGKNNMSYKNITTIILTCKILQIIVTG